MQREALKLETGPDKTKREAGKIRERTRLEDSAGL